MCERSAADVVASALEEARMRCFDDIVAGNDVDESWIHCTTEALFPHSCVPEVAWLTLFSSIHVLIGLSLNLTLCFHFLAAIPAHYQIHLELSICPDILHISLQIFHPYPFCWEGI